MVLSALVHFTVIVFLSQETHTCKFFYAYPLLLFNQASTCCKRVFGLDGKGVILHLHAPVHAILKTYM